MTLQSEDSNCDALSQYDWQNCG